MKNGDTEGLTDNTNDAESLASAKQKSRRDVVRAGIKLAFVAPVISTFFAQDAMAYVHSCYPVGHACAPGAQEPCCNGLSCTAFTCT